MSKPSKPLPLSDRLECFIELGKRLRSLDSATKESVSQQAKAENPWFTESNVLLALSSLGEMLDEDGLVNFVLAYPTLKEDHPVRTIGLVLAGNIPAVGFHDLYSVLIAGHIAEIKLSKSDSCLMGFLIGQIEDIEPRFVDFIQRVDRLSNFDAVICTGSDNSSRYFEYYFGKYPNIIRKNRTSVALLQGDETAQELKLLADDIFTYYGFGCRNVSKIYLPKGSEVVDILPSFEHYSFIGHHHKYANNYDYNKAIFLVNQQHCFDTGFLIVKEDTSLFSPLSVLHFEYYEDFKELLGQLGKWEKSIQCVVSKIPQVNNKIAFGNTQRPSLTDYADGIDVVEFLLQLP